MKIGIVSPWFERGIAFISLNIYKALAQEHEMFVLAPSSPVGFGPEWDVPNLTRNDKQFKLPLEWIEKNRIDVIIFNERTDTKNLLRLRERSVKLVCFHEWEFIFPEMSSSINECFDINLAPTACSFQAFSAMGMKNIRRIHWGTDLALFYPRRKNSQEPLVFIHTANYGGMHGRKNTLLVRQAWLNAQTDDAKLFICQQNRSGIYTEGSITVLAGTLLQQELATFMGYCNVALMPSRWEGLGQGFIEALASGLALLTVDAPPMNEYIVPGINGIASPILERESPEDIAVKDAHLEMNVLADKITCLCKNKGITLSMGEQSRKIAEKQFNWTRNSQELLDIINELQ